MTDVVEVLTEWRRLPQGPIDYLQMQRTGDRMAEIIEEQRAEIERLRADRMRYCGVVALLRRLGPPTNADDADCYRQALDDAAKAKVPV